MWNIVEVCEEKNTCNFLNSFDGRPLLFTEKRYADRMVQELSEKNKDTVKYFVVEYIDGQAH